MDGPVVCTIGCHRQRRRFEPYRRLHVQGRPLARSPPPPPSAARSSTSTAGLRQVCLVIFLIFAGAPPPPVCLAKTLHHRPLQQCAPRPVPSAARSSCVSSSFASAEGPYRQ